MQQLPWLNRLPDSTIEGGVELTNQLYWNISLTRVGRQWSIFSGDSLIFSSDSRQETNAFLYGLSLAYAVLPGDIFERLREDLRRLNRQLDSGT